MTTPCAAHLPPRRPRASPLWQLVHHGWEELLANYESKHRKDLGPLHPAAVTTVESFLRCGDLASGFTRLQCPECGHERLLAFTCKGRHFCPSCHQRRVRSTSDWIATAVCHDVPDRHRNPPKDPRRQDSRLKTRNSDFIVQLWQRADESIVAASL